MEIVALIMSFISIVVSTLTEIKISRVPMKDHFNTYLFDDLLLKRIPFSLMTYYKNGNKASSQTVITNMQEFRSAITFYKFYDSEKFDKLATLYTDLDEHFTLLCNKKNIENNREKIDNTLRKIYRIVYQWNFICFLLSARVARFDKFMVFIGSKIQHDNNSRL